MSTTKRQLEAAQLYEEHEHFINQIKTMRDSLLLTFDQLAGEDMHPKAAMELLEDFIKSYLRHQPLRTRAERVQAYVRIVRALEGL